jgi:hypothetical protein
MSQEEIWEACWDRGLPTSDDEKEMRRLLQDWTQNILLPKKPTLKVEALVVYSIMKFLEHKL